MFISKRTACNSKKSEFIKKQDASELLSKLGMKTALSKISILGDVLFIGY